MLVLILLQILWIQDESENFQQNRTVQILLNRLSFS